MAAAGTSPAVLKAKSGVTSMRLSLTQDMFNEVSSLIVKIADSSATSLKIEDQHIKKHIPLLGEVEAASAKNIRILSFDIRNISLEIKDAYVAVAISDVDFHVEMDVATVLSKAERVDVKADVDVLGKLKFGLTGKHCTTDVYDIKTDVSNFDAESKGFTGEILAHFVDLLEKVLRPVIEQQLDAVVASSLSSSLNAMLNRNFDLVGAVSGVNYKFQVDILSRISGARGVEFDVGVDAFFNTDKDKPFEVDTVARDVEKVTL
ncbi:hypothetical protein HDU82_005674 [Entophlyctis luteolus]|nr:hypothetical protein HDU82_005674 [Entophlyctis luteolus]